MIYNDPTSVKAVQTAINAAGYQPPLVVDGLVGPKTTSGVRWFQQLHGLTVDGLIGPATMAATIAPTPAQAAAAASNPLASLTAQISALQAAATSVPAATPAPLATAPVTAMSNVPMPSVGPGGVMSTSSAAPPRAAMAYKSPVPASPLMGNVGGIPIPALIGAAAGAALGAFGGLVWILAGAAGGGAAGYGLTMLPSAKGATMHGEDDSVDFCLESDYGCDVTPGEIGCETKSSKLLA